MGFPVRDIIEKNIFPGARLAAGAAGLQAEISWVNVMEIVDSPDTVQQGELLVTTGYGLDDSRVYGDLIARLKARGVSALAIQLYYIDKIPSYILETADRYGFAVLEFPKELTFSEILHTLFHRISTEAAAPRPADDQHAAALAFLRRETTAQKIYETPALTAHALYLEALNYSPVNQPVWDDSLKQIRSVLMADASICRMEKLPGGSAIILVAYPAEVSHPMRFYTLNIRLTLLSEQLGTNIYIGAEHLHTAETLPLDFRHAIAAIDELRAIKARRGLCTHEHTTFIRMFGILHQTDRSIVLENQALQVLFNYDRMNKTAYVHTLRTYLAMGCNASRAAAHLFIHRHSLLKRLDKITALTQLDLDDYYTRLYMSIALLFHDYFAY